MQQLSKYPVLQNFEQRTQVPKTYAVIGTVALLGFLLLINTLAQPVSNLIGWGLPAYLSFKAIESPSAQDDVQWLTYWVVFGSFNLLESFALRMVLYYFPWYFAFKTVFVLWLQLPAFRVSVITGFVSDDVVITDWRIISNFFSYIITQGAQTTYHAVLKPLLANVSSKSPAIYQQTTTASGSSD